MRDGNREIRLPDCLALSSGCKAQWEKMTSAQRREAIGALRELAALHDALCHASGIDEIRFILHLENGFAATRHHILPKGFLGYRVVPAIYIDPSYISGLKHFAGDDAARDPLCFNTDELYAVLAHEVGHLQSPHWDALKAEHEFEADEKAIRLGARADAMASATLKMTRHERELCWRFHRAAGQDPSGIFRYKSASEWLAMRQQIGSESLGESALHPSLAVRHTRAKQAEQSWQKKLKEEAPDLREDGKGR